MRKIIALTLFVAMMVVAVPAFAGTADSVYSITDAEVTGLNISVPNSGIYVTPDSGYTDDALSGTAQKIKTSRGEPGFTIKYADGVVTITGDFSKFERQSSSDGWSQLITLPFALSVGVKGKLWEQEMNTASNPGDPDEKGDLNNLGTVSSSEAMPNTSYPSVSVSPYGYVSTYYKTINFQPVAGGNSQEFTFSYYAPVGKYEAEVDVSDSKTSADPRDLDFNVTKGALLTKTIKVVYVDTEVDADDDSEASFSAIAAGQQANNFNAKVSGNVLYLDIAATTKDDVKAILSAAGDSNNYANFTAKITPKDKDGSTYAYRTTVTFMDIKNDVSLSGTLRYMDRGANVYVLDENGQFTVTFYLPLLYRTDTALTATEIAALTSADKANTALYYEKTTGAGDWYKITWSRVSDDPYTGCKLTSYKDYNSMIYSLNEDYGFSFRVDAGSKSTVAVVPVVRKVARTSSAFVVENTEMTVAVGDTKKIEVTYVDPNAFKQTVSYSSFLTAYATVNSSGEVKGVKAGTGYIKVANSTDEVLVVIKVVDEYPEDGGSTEEGIGQYKVAASNLYVRSGPGTGYTALGKNPRGTIVTVVEIVENGAWAKIIYKDDFGYSSMKYLTKIEVEPVTEAEAE